METPFFTSDILDLNIQTLGHSHLSEVVDQHDPLIYIQGRVGDLTPEADPCVVNDDVHPSV